VGKQLLQKCDKDSPSARRVYMGMTKMGQKSRSLVLRMKGSTGGSQLKSELTYIETDYARGGDENPIYQHK